MAYTVHDEPDVVKRIRHDLDLVIETVREADPGFRSIVLTGGFSRGEGAILRGRPQNDYDFVVFRGRPPPERDYDAVRKELEARLGLHVDLATVPTWRIPYLRRSIFWYETRHRGRTLYGDDLLSEIPIQSPWDLAPDEALRLLSNRAAGLLLVTPSADAHARRIQASKAILATLDAHLLSLGAFAPSQRERFDHFRRLERLAPIPDALRKHRPWLTWAFSFKTDPGHAEPRDAMAAWRIARRLLLDMVPTALAIAGLSRLEEYARRDGLIDHLVFLHRWRRLTGVRSWTWHPTSRVRVATLRLLEECADGRPPLDTANRWLRPLGAQDHSPVQALELLRRATLQ